MKVDGESHYRISVSNHRNGRVRRDLNRVLTTSSFIHWLKYEVNMIIMKILLSCG